MGMNEKGYPRDVYGVKNYGIERWLKTFFVPIKGEEYIKIYKTVLQDYLSIILKYKNDDIVYNIATPNLKLINIIVRYIFVMSRNSRLREKGYEYVIGKREEKLSDVYAFSFPELSIINNGLFHSNIKMKIRNCLMILKHNCNPSIVANRNFYKNILSPSFIIGDRNDKEVNAYCNAMGITPILIPVNIFARNELKADNSVEQNHEVISFLQDFMSLVKERYPDTRDSSFGIIENGIKELFSNSLLFYLRNIKVLKKCKPGVLLVYTLGNTLHRLFASAWRSAGGEVVGFPHANQFCYYAPYLFLYEGLMLTDKWIVSSKGQGDILKDIALKYPFGLRIPRIILNTQSFYFSLFKKLQKCEPVSSIRRIMIIGSSMLDELFFSLPAYTSLTYLHLEIRIAKLLKAAGYYVIYKAHPETLDEVSGVFDDYVDEVNTNNRFENVFDQADCLIFTNSGSTTFGFSLLTNRPIVSINIKRELWFPRAFELLKKRCCIVNAEIDDLERVIFDEREFINAVEASLTNINYDILYEFAF